MPASRALSAAVHPFFPDFHWLMSGCGIPSSRANSASLPTTSAAFCIRSITDLFGVMVLVLSVSFDFVDSLICVFTNQLYQIGRHSMINLKSGKPGTGMVYTEGEARSAAFSLKVQCQFANPDCIYMASCGCPYVCTPPAENSNPSGASDGADGQGVCTPSFFVHWWLANGVLSSPGVARTGTVVARTVDHARRIRDVLISEPGLYVIVESVLS